MKHYMTLFFVCLVCLFSCDMSGSGKTTNTSHSTDNSMSLVSVKLSVTSPKSIECSYSQNSQEYYLYKATPLFTGDNIQGQQKTFTVFDNGNSVMYFSKGKWKFDVQAVYGNSVEESGLLSTGSKTVNLTASTTVDIEMNNSVGSDTLTGEADFTITVKQVGANPGVIKVYDGETLVDTFEYEDVPLSSTLEYSGILTLAPGFKELRFDYVENDVLSSQVISIRIIENAKITISGSLDNTESTNANLSASYPKLTVSVSGNSSIQLGNSGSVYQCTASGGVATYHYQWYVNGSKINGQTGSSYSFAQENKCGVYTLTCIVYCVDASEKIYGSASIDVRVVK